MAHFRPHNASVWELDRLLRAMYILFKDVPARRAQIVQYIGITGKMLFPVKFCQIRHRVGSECCGRQKSAIEVFDDLCKFVKTAMLPQITSVVSIKEASSYRLAKSKIACFVSIAQSLKGFLTTFQSQSLWAPLLYDDLTELVKSLMLRCISCCWSVEFDAAMHKLLLECPHNRCCQNRRHQIYG